ncbi:MAG: YabP/YqfC family sporulation protein [Clostridia bacterium]|nr:YabP/YqfC family sporulation protein [Clostridia bacterium]
MPESIRKKLSELLSLPVDVISGIPVFTVRGREELEVDGCTGILVYEADRVVLSVKGQRMTVKGEKLRLEDFRDTTLTVRGRIVSLSFGEED